MTKSRGNQAAAIATLMLLGACAVDVGDDAEPEVVTLEAEYSPGAGWGTPIFSEAFGKATLDSHWIQEGTASRESCYSINNGELVLPPKKRTDCYLYNNTTFNGDEPGVAYMFAAKVKLSQTNGNHPSFWLHGPRGQALYNEYDIVESYGSTSGDPDRPCASGTVTSTSGKGFYNVQFNHYSAVGPTTGRRDCFTRSEASSALDGNYHVFAMMWAPGRSVEMYFDGKRTARWGANHALGGSEVIALTNLLNEIKDANGTITGYKDVTGNGAPNMRLKWVRVWKKSNVSAREAGVPPTSPTSRAVIDPVFYLASYPDLRAAFGTDSAAALQHWQNYGIREGRVASPAFDVNHYRAANPDLQGLSNADLVNHFATYGIYEARETSPFFNVTQYLASYGDLGAAFGDAPEGAFDHFMTYGIGEGRVGSASFNAPWYLQANPDVAAAYGATNYLGAMAHWQGWGRTEGRPGAP